MTRPQSLHVLDDHTDIVHGLEQIKYQVLGLNSLPSTPSSTKKDSPTNYPLRRSSFRVSIPASDFTDSTSDVHSRPSTAVFTPPTSPLSPLLLSPPPTTTRHGAHKRSSAVSLSPSYLAPASAEPISTLVGPVARRRPTNLHIPPFHFPSPRSPRSPTVPSPHHLSPPSPSPYYPPKSAVSDSFLEPFEAPSAPFRPIHSTASSPSLPSTFRHKSGWLPDVEEDNHNHKLKPPKYKRAVISDREIPHAFETALPTKQQLLDAAPIPVLGPMGKPVPFRDLIQDKKTIVCFIRHFFCPQCQDYMLSIAEQADPELLKKANINLVIISNGSPAMIKAYLRISKAPFQLYTDPTLRLYDALGMNLRTKAFGTKVERGEYIQHGFLVGVLNGIKRGLKSGMPMLANAGDLDQVGGEFIMGPGLRCEYAHRMISTTSHDSIRALMTRAGMALPPLPLPDDLLPPPTRTRTISLTSKRSKSSAKTWIQKRTRDRAMIEEGIKLWKEGQKRDGMMEEQMSCGASVVGECGDGSTSGSGSGGSESTVLDLHPPKPLANGYGNGHPRDLENGWANGHANGHVKGLENGWANGDVFAKPAIKVMSPRSPSPILR